MTKAERQREWESRVAEFRASGQSTKEWCAAHDLKPYPVMVLDSEVSGGRHTYRHVITVADSEGR